MSEWVLQGVAGRIAIKRFKNLSDSDADKILSRAKFYYGRPYDFYFLFDKEAIYCSELVYYAFEEGAQISLGNIERVGDLRTQSTAVKNLIKERWKSYPICLDQGVDSYEGCYDIVMNQNLITPSSVAEDSRLEIIYSNYY